MNRVRYTERDLEETIVAAAAQAACEALDHWFPGWDNGGITSNFQGLLADHIRAMLAGQKGADHRHAISLPVLAPLPEVAE